MNLICCTASFFVDVLFLFLAALFCCRRFSFFLPALFVAASLVFFVSSLFFSRRFSLVLPFYIFVAT